MKKIILLTIYGLFFFCKTHAAIFTVTNVSDNAGTANSLRWCITQANLTAAKDTIKFTTFIAFAPATSYPAKIYPLCIDGFSATGAVQGALGAGTRVLKVVINGPGDATTYGLNITTNNCEIKGIVFQDMFKGIYISGATSTANWIWGCYIGTAANGLSSTVNEACYDDGIGLANNASSNIIGTNGDGTNDANEGNLISANGDGAWGNGESIAINEGGAIGTNCSANRIAPVLPWPECCRPRA